MYWDKAQQRKDKMEKEANKYYNDLSSKLQAIIILDTVIG